MVSKIRCAYEFGCPIASRKGTINDAISLVSSWEGRLECYVRRSSTNSSSECAVSLKNPRKLVELGQAIMAEVHELLPVALGVFLVSTSLTVWCILCKSVDSRYIADNYAHYVVL